MPESPKPESPKPPPPPPPDQKTPEPGHENIAPEGAPPVVVDPSIRG
jgi:hypothetical protein